MGKASRRRGGAGSVKRPASGSVETLIAEAEELLANEQFDRGLALLRQAHARAPTHIQAAELLGLWLAECGREEAAAVLRTAVRLSPDVGHEKFFALGHVAPGAEGLMFLRRGVQLLEAAAVDDDSLRGELCAGLNSLAEGLLDAAERPEGDSAALPPPAREAALAEAEALLERACAAAPAAPEPLFTRAALAAAAGREADALRLLRASLAKWRGGDGGASARSGDDDFDELPSFEFRFQTARLLLDLDDTTDAAVSVLEGLLSERDDQPAVWHLLALAHHGACAFARATSCLDAAAELLSRRPAEEREELEAEVAELRAAVEVSAIAWRADGLAALDAGEEEEEEEEEAAARGAMDEGE